MKLYQLFVLVFTLSFNSMVIGKDQVNTTEDKNMSHEKIFKQLVGHWQGTVKTWFEPGKLADESEVKGEFEAFINENFVRHTYEGSIKGKVRKGEELIAFNSVTKQFEQTWVDSFHMNYAIFVANGPTIENGFSVKGKYDVAEGIPRWGWRTDFVFVDTNHLTITAYNISPEGEEAKAVETVYIRQ